MTGDFLRQINLRIQPVPKSYAKFLRDSEGVFNTKHEQHNVCDWIKAHQDRHRRNYKNGYRR